VFAYIIQSDQKVTQPRVWNLVLTRNECDQVELVDEHVVDCAETVSGQAQAMWPDAITAVAFKLCVNWHIFSQGQCFFIVEQYLHSQSYLKYQNDFRSAFPKSQVQDESTVFCSVTSFHETGSVSDQKHSACHALWNDMNVEIIHHSLGQSP